MFIRIYFIFRNNSCEINLIDCFEKKDVHPENFDKSDVPKDREDLAGKYTSKLRKSTVKLFTKKAVWYINKIIKNYLLISMHIRDFIKFYQKWLFTIFNFLNVTIY